MRIIFCFSLFLHESYHANQTLCRICFAIWRGRAFTDVILVVICYNKDQMSRAHVKYSYRCSLLCVSRNQIKGTESICASLVTCEHGDTMNTGGLKCIMFKLTKSIHKMWCRLHNGLPRIC